MRRPGAEGPHSIWSLSHQRLLRQHQSVGTKFLSLIFSFLLYFHFLKFLIRVHQVGTNVYLWFSILTPIQEKWGNDNICFLSLIFYFLKCSLGYFLLSRYYNGYVSANESLEKLARWNFHHRRWKSNLIKIEEPPSLIWMKERRGEHQLSARWNFHNS